MFVCFHLDIRERDQLDGNLTFRASDPENYWRSVKLEKKTRFEIRDEKKTLETRVSKCEEIEKRI